MKIQFLGTGDAFCSGGRFQTSFFVSSTEFNFLIDCGGTTLLALKSQKVAIEQLDGVLISHFHGDHFGGLPYLLLALKFQTNRSKPFFITGPHGVAERVGELLDRLYPGVSVNDFPFRVVFSEFSGHLMDFGPIKIESHPVIHVAETLPHGLRVYLENKCLAFSGDTGWTDNLYKIAAQADLFICECNFYKTETSSHLNYHKIIAEAEKLDYHRIILNHFGTEMLEKLKEVELECSYDGLVIDL